MSSPSNLAICDGLLFHNRECKRCGTNTKQEISCLIMSSGEKHYGWWCLNCNNWTTSKGRGTWIKKDELIASGVNLDVVPIVQINELNRCSVCHKRGAQYHHWAPKGIFGEGEAEKWPKDLLCNECHAKWHNRVTPQLMLHERTVG